MKRRAWEVSRVKPRGNCRIVESRGRIKLSPPPWKGFPGLRERRRDGEGPHRRLNRCHDLGDMGSREEF